MARQPRIEFPDAVYHVTSRGNGRARIFFGDEDRTRFLAQLGDGLETAAVVLYAYVLMDNHYHLLVRTPRANLSQFMRRLNTSYALYARYKHNNPGHQFGERFGAKLVQEDVYLLALTRYIHLNPVKVAACRRVNKLQRVRRLEEYRWSSYPGYVNGKCKHDFVCYDVLKHFGLRMPTARRHYRAYTHACVMDDDRPILDAIRASRHAIGEPPFIEAKEQQLEGRRTGEPKDQDLALPGATVGIDVIDALVAKHYHIQPRDLKTHGRRSGDAKFVAVELACRLTGMNQRAVGVHYGGITSAAVSTIRRKIREGQYHVASVVERLLTDLGTGSDFKY